MPNAKTRFDLSTIPEYTSIPYVEINNNIPYFVEGDYTTTSFEKYSEWDYLGRSGVAYANICKEIMPKENEKRGEIGNIKDLSGWVQKRYDDLIKDKYLYNRCHLIGWQLAGENDNKKKLITDNEKDNHKNGRTKGGGTRYIKWKEDERTDMGLKQPGSLYFPYVERFGLLLLRFLNADLSTYETSYKDFFYAYGFEILKDIDEDYKFELKGKYEDDETYLKETKKIYDMLKEQLLYIQEQITEAVNYIYNINESEELKPFTHSQRYAVYLIKRKGKLYSYIKNDEVIADNYSNKYEELGSSADIDLLNKLKEEGMLISMVNTHKSNDISSVCYAILEELSKTDNYPIKKCQNCGMYFIPNSRLDEIYCDYPKENGKTCREQGAILSYNKRLQEKSAYTEYRKTYQQKFGVVNKNKDNKKLKKEFETWKKQAKEKITKLKHTELTEDEVYKWLQENK